MEVLCVAGVFGLVAQAVLVFVAGAVLVVFGAALVVALELSGSASECDDDRDGMDHEP